MTIYKYQAQWHRSLDLLYRVSSIFNCCSWFSNVDWWWSISLLYEFGFFNIVRKSRDFRHQSSKQILQNCKYQICRRSVEPSDGWWCFVWQRHETPFYIYTKSDSYVIPSSYQSIDNKAFHELNLLTAINITKLITFISKCAFELCNGFVSVVFPDTVTFISKKFSIHANDWT